MLKAHYLYSKLPVNELEKMVISHQEEFAKLLEDNFNDEELASFESQLDSIAAIYVQPIILELNFDDLNPDLINADKQQLFFETCRSTICLEELPFFENNPFQVTYLLMLLKIFDEVLIDRGGNTPLIFKDQFLEILKKYKKMDLTLMPFEMSPNKIKSSQSVSPIDFVLVDIYKELNRCNQELIMDKAEQGIESMNEKVKKIFNLVKKEKLDSQTLFFKAGINPKDFDDNLEKLKFYLRKV